MCSQNIFEGTDYTAGQVLISSILSCVLSASLKKIPRFSIKGLNYGRNSFSAITKSISTKYANNVIKNMSMKTLGKIFVSNLYDSTYGILSDAFFSILDDDDEEEVFA